MNVRGVVRDDLTKGRNNMCDAHSARIMIRSKNIENGIAA
jgi:hypothetical protein